MGRQTGLTTQQMLDAPIGSVYVWLNGDLVYPKQLAAQIGRKDLQIVMPSWLHEGWRGIRLTGIVVDHAARYVLTDRQVDGLAQARLRVKSNTV